MEGKVKENFDKLVNSSKGIFDDVNKIAAEKLDNIYKENQKIMGCQTDL
jgi:hypothetical protein